MSLMKAWELKAFGDKILAANVTPSELLGMASRFGINLDETVASLITEKIPSFIHDGEETLTQFVTGGGLIEMLAAQMSGNAGANSCGSGRCPHCKNLVFF